MHRCILCIGSNYRAETYMGMAEMLLNQRFPSIRWGKLIKTLPVSQPCRLAQYDMGCRHFAVLFQKHRKSLRTHFPKQTDRHHPPRHRLADDRQHRP